VAEYADESGFTGILLFTGNDVPVDPWCLAQFVVERTVRLSPLIAINPSYIHPFAAAKALVSLTLLYGRQFCVNLVAGTSIRGQTALGDTLAHDDRYARLAEFAYVIQQLLTSAKPIRFDGDYYQISDLQLPWKIPIGLRSEFLLAGHSRRAVELAERNGCVRVQMLPALVEAGKITAKGVNFGVVARESVDAAWDAARQLFPDTPEGRILFEYSIQNTDAAWKNDLAKAVERQSSVDAGYWLSPLLNCQADCPYFVGSYETVAKMMDRLYALNVTHLLLDVLPDRREFDHLNKALQMLELNNKTMDRGFDS
jgi:alkanesulfonate monooxygenase